MSFADGTPLLPGDPLFDWPMVIIDTESTGLAADPQARVIEVGGVLLDTDGTELEAFSVLLEPEVWSTRADAALHYSKLNRRQLRLCGRRFWTLEVVGPAWKRAQMHAWRVTHEQPLLGLLWPPYSHPSAWGPCLKVLATEAFGAFGVQPRDPSDGLRLAEALEHLGLGAAPHRALDDARAAAAVTIELRRRGLLPLLGGNRR